MTRCWLLISSFLVIIVPILASKEDWYLYKSLDNDGGRPIVEYFTPEGEKANNHPDFLYQEDFPHHRVVEFYSHTCPHCQRFAPHYIEFGRKFQEHTQKHSAYANLDVQFYAISCFVHREICKQEKIRGYPTVKIYKANTNKGMKFAYYELHPETLVKKLGIETVNDNWKAEEEEIKKVEEAEAAKSIEPQQPTTSQAEEKPAFLARRKTEVFGDAYLSFHTAMKTAVFLDDSNQLSPEKQKALQKWLTLLQRVLPPWRIHPLLEGLLGGGNFTASIQTEATWMEILNQHPPQNTDYSPACQLHESPYTCGLWTLFHIVTVGVVEFNSAIVNEEANKFVVLNMETVAKQLRDFVQHFLLCEVCVNHFLQEFDSCSYDRCTRFPPRTGELKDWKEFPFWLLETHNGVNVRLQWERRGNGVDAIMPEQQKSVMWPPASDCPTCWLESNGAASAKRYNQTMMYDYLRLNYWPDDTHSVVVKEDLLRTQNPPSVAANVDSASGISSIQHDGLAGLDSSETIVDSSVALRGNADDLDAKTSSVPEPSTETNTDTTTTGDDTTVPQDTTKADTAEEEASSNGDPFTVNIKVISKEVQYSMIIMLLIVIAVWNKRRIRRKLAINKK